MEIFLENSVITATLEFGIENVAAAEYRVFDQAHVELVPLTSLSVGAGETSKEITVPANLNTLGAAPRGMRTIELRLVSLSGERKYQTYSYILEGSQDPTIPAQTFQTYEQAVLLALDMPNLPGWNLADEAARRQALREAHYRLNGFSYSLLEASEFPDFPGLGEASVFNSSLAGLTNVEWLELPAVFLEAIRRAQVAEAEAILAGASSIEARRADGLVSMTVGESSSTFSPLRPVRSQVARRTMDYIGRFVRSGKRLGRS